MKHKHCEVIKAWADGARIEYKPSNMWVEAQFPQFNPIFEYRVMKEHKTIKVQGWLNIYADGYYSKIYESKEIAERESIEYTPHKTIFISEEIELEE